MTHDGMTTSGIARVVAPWTERAAALRIVSFTAVLPVIDVPPPLRVTVPRFNPAKLVARMTETYAALAREERQYEQMARQIALAAQEAPKAGDRFLEISRRAYASFRLQTVDMLPPNDHPKLVRLQRAERRRLERAQLSAALLSSLTRPIESLARVLCSDQPNGPNSRVASATGRISLA